MFGRSLPLPRGRERLHSAVPNCLESACGGKEFDQSFGTFNVSRAGHHGGRKHLHKLDLRCDNLRRENLICLLRSIGFDELTSHHGIPTAEDDTLPHRMAAIVHHSKNPWLMSARGQYLPKSDVCITSVQLPITDSYRTSRQVGSGPKCDIAAPSLKQRVSLVLIAEPPAERADFRKNQRQPLCPRRASTSEQSQDRFPGTFCVCGGH